MGPWGEITAAADAAQAKMLSNRDEGERVFEALLRAHPADGMVYFKRGQGYEAIGEFALAVADYKTAESLFPKPEWKARAADASKRLSALAELSANRPTFASAPEVARQPDRQARTGCTFCTYCSFSKSREPGLLPPFRRYQSARIDRVLKAAAELGVGFGILSGKYGLVGSNEPQIPYYDHLLGPEEVSRLASVVVDQLRELRVTSIVYFTRPLDDQPTLWPYHDTIVIACSRASIRFLAVEIG